MTTSMSSLTRVAQVDAGAALARSAAPKPPAGDGAEGGLRQAFDQFVGEVFFGQMLAAMRQSTGKAAYFNGGRAEEIFQGQLDQVLAEKLTESSAQTFTGPMYDLFSVQRR